MSELNRLAFVLERDGVEKALAFAYQTQCIYRKSVLQSLKRGYGRPHHASSPSYRRGFIESYLHCKRFIESGGRL